MTVPDLSAPAPWEDIDTMGGRPSLARWVRRRDLLKPVPPIMLDRGRCQACGCDRKVHSRILAGEPCLDCPDCGSFIGKLCPNPAAIISM